MLRSLLQASPEHQIRTHSSTRPTSVFKKTGWFKNMSRICICISFDNFELNLEMRFEQKERRLHRLLISIDRQHQPVARNRQNQVSKNMTSSSRGKTGQNRLNKQNIDIPVKLNTLTLVNSIIHSKNKQTCSKSTKFPTETVS